jgi:hypothetical protein
MQPLTAKPAGKRSSLVRDICSRTMVAFGLSLTVAWLMLLGYGMVALIQRAI